MNTNSRKRKNKLKKPLILIFLIVILLIVGILVYKNMSNETTPVNNKNVSQNSGESVDKPEENVPQEKVDIIDVESNTRPYALVINDTPVAVKVQEGLNKAYLVYELPTEGNTSRLIALYKDVEESLVIGTIRSARHDFIDYALESDAIFCCFGWSHYAQDDLGTGIIDYLQGLYGEPFYRNNPEGLAKEHTGYTSIAKLNEAVASKGIRNTTDKPILLNYNVSDTDLSLAENVEVANKVTIPYGSKPEVSSFEYNPETKMYTRYENSNKCIDHNTKEAVTTKNIIVQKINYEKCDDGYYWDLETVGSGDGYYITNGYAVPIEWKKVARAGQTQYTYKEGTIIDGENVGGQEISVSDGKTWISLQTTSQKLTIE